MSVVLFIAATAIVMIGALLFTAGCRFIKMSDKLLTAFVIALAQIIASLLIAGFVLKKFEPYTVVIVNFVITGLLYLWYAGAARRSSAFDSRDKEPNDEQGTSIVAPLADRIFAGILLAAAAFELLWQLIVVYLMPPSDWDSLYYHLVSIAYWIQEGRIGYNPFSVWSNVYPHNAELIYSWLMLFFHHDRWVEFGQMIFTLGGVLAVSGIARRLGLNRWISLASGCLFMLTPIVLSQSKTNYVDVAFAAMFLFAFYFAYRYIQYRRTLFVFLSGLSGGIALGIKSTGVAYIGVIVLMLVACVLYDKFARGELRLGTTAARVIVFTVPVVLYGALWYIRNWYHYGNPIYPFIVKLFGRTIFPGEGTVNELIMVSNTPKEIIGLPLWKQIWLSWTHEPNVVHFDERLGGFGLQWISILAPAILVFTAYTLWKKRDYFFAVCLPFLVIFFVQPSSWWSRYTIFIVALGAVSFAYILHLARQLRPLSVLLQVVLVFAVFISLAAQFKSFDMAAIKRAYHLPPEQRTIGQLYRPEYQFVDALPHDARLGVRYSFFPYPFFGINLQHHVDMLNQTSEQDFVRFVHERNLDYVIPRGDSPYVGWADKHPDIFTERTIHYEFVQYKVNKAALEQY